MGNRYTFTTDELGVSLPQWFIDKWERWCNIPDGCFPVSSKEARKRTVGWAELEEDLNAWLRSTPASRSPGIVRLVWLGEDGDVVLSTITALCVDRRRLQTAEEATRP